MRILSWYKDTKIHVHVPYKSSAIIPNCELYPCQLSSWLSTILVSGKLYVILPEASLGLRVMSLPASVCMCFRLCPFKLGSPNLDHRLRPVVFSGVIDLDLQGQICQSQNLPHFELVRVITPNLDQRCKVLWLRSLLFWGLIELNDYFIHSWTIFRQSYDCIDASEQHWIYE